MRVQALVRDLAAIVARVDVLAGARPPFAQESASFFGIAPGPIEETDLSAIRAQVADLIGGGDRLVDRYAAFAARFTIPPARLQPVMVAALDACRAATVAHLTLPAGEQARLEFVTNKPWSAFSRYLGGGRSVIQINTDFRFTVDQALQIACHEGYPGHHTRNALRTGAGDAAAGWPERSVQLTFSPESLTSEASAMLAADVAFPPDERVRLERATLFPLAGLPAALAEAHIEVERLVGQLQIVQADVARRYLDGQLEFTRAAAELEQRALVPHAETQIKYINQYRSYVTTYTDGPRGLCGAAGGVRRAPAPCRPSSALALFHQRECDALGACSIPIAVKAARNSDTDAAAGRGRRVDVPRLTVTPGDNPVTSKRPGPLRRRTLNMIVIIHMMAIIFFQEDS